MLSAAQPSAIVALLFVGLMVVVIVLMIRVADLSRQVKRLEEHLGFRPSRPKPPIPRSRPTYVPPPSPPGQDTPVSTAPAPAQTPTTPPQAVQQRPAAPSAAVAPPTVRKPSRTGREWEALIGERWLNRIGALALIIGIGFFLRHAFQQNWIGPAVRVLIGVAIGSAALVIASRLRERYQIFSQGILGAGVAVLYLSVFASFNFYSLISQPIAFVAMSTVTAITFERALKFESLAVGLLGWAGGFLTPALLWESSGTSSGTGLFIYLVALNVAMLGLAALRSRTWWILEPLSFFATWLTYAIWIDAEFVDPLRVPTVAFVVVIWSLYFVLQIRKLTAAEPKRRALNVLIGGLNAAFVLGALSTLIGEPYPNVMGAVAFAFAIIYLGTSMALPKTQVSLEITAASFLLLAIGFQFEDFVAVGLWSLEALFLFWRGLTKDRRYLRFTALAIYGIAAFGLLVTDGALSVASPSRFTVLANTRFAAFAVVATLGYFSAQLYRNHEASEKGWVPSLLHYLWGALVFILFTVETVDFYRGLMATAAPLETQGLVFSRAMVLALVWAAFGLGMIGFAYLTELKPTAMVGLFGLGLAIALAAMRGIVFEPATDFTLILNLRALAMMGVIGAVVASMKLLNEMPEGIKELQRVLGSLVALLIFVLVTGETRDIFQKQLADVVPPPSGFLPQPPTDDQLTRINTLENQKQLAISGIWLAYSFIGMAIGILRRRLGYRIAAIVLFGVIIVKVFFFDLSFLDSIYRTTSFIGLGLILLLVSFLYQRYRSVLFEPRNPTPGPQSEPPASP